MLLTKAKTASIKIAKNRKGMDNNQMTGHKRRINTAIGQQKTNNIAQRTITINIFIPCSYIRCRDKLSY